MQLSEAQLVVEQEINEIESGIMEVNDASADLQIAENDLVNKDD
jgi:hypothetical protein